MMADPLSIATGIIALLGSCISVGKAIKDVHDGAAIADVKVKGLLSDVESFAQVLRMMKDTLEEEKVQSSLQATGHIGNHWKNVSTSISDGQNTLIQLQSTVEKVNKHVGVLDGARKHLRLKGAAQEIVMYQQQIRSYRDTIQLSLQTVILWNQVTFKESTDKILPNLDELHESIRRIAFDINARMVTLQTLVESTSKAEQVQTLTNLRNCVQSAASVVSSASTTLGIERTDHSSITYGSEFGDCFPSEPSETMLRWVSSNTVYEFEEDLPQTSPAQDQKVASAKGSERSSNKSESDHSDSDNDLEVEIVKALLRRGKERLNAEDFRGAERLLRNCLTRTTSSTSLSTLHRASKSEVMVLLIKTYQQQQKWNEAQSILIEKISLGSLSTAGDNSNVLSDMLTLVEVLLKKKAHAEALLYCRRALKGYRRMGMSGTAGVGKALQLLVTISHAEGNVDEEEAYTVMLSDFIDRQVSEKDDSPFEGPSQGGLPSHSVSVLTTGLVPRLPSPGRRNSRELSSTAWNIPTSMSDLSVKGYSPIPEDDLPRLRQGIEKSVVDTFESPRPLQQSGVSENPNARKYEDHYPQEDQSRRRPTSDLTDIVPILDRKRRLTQWDIRPPGYENVTAEQAKLSGMFPLPGASRLRDTDLTKWGVPEASPPTASVPETPQVEIRSKEDDKMLPLLSTPTQQPINMKKEKNSRTNSPITSIPEGAGIDNHSPDFDVEIERQRESAIHPSAVPYHYPEINSQPWMLHLNNLIPNGTIYINGKSYERLVSSINHALLTLDVVMVDGEFERDSAVRLVKLDEGYSALPRPMRYQGLDVGKALVNYNSVEIARMKGLDSDGIERHLSHLGYVGTRPVANGSDIRLFRKPLSWSRPVSSISGRPPARQAESISSADYGGDHHQRTISGGESVSETLDGGEGRNRDSIARESLARELETLRSHWEATNKNYPLNPAFDYNERTLQGGDVGAGVGPGDTKRGELRSSLADWRKTLDQQEEAVGSRKTQNEEARLLAEERNQTYSDGRTVTSSDGRGHTESPLQTHKIPPQKSTYTTLTTSGGPSRPRSRVDIDEEDFMKLDSVVDGSGPPSPPTVEPQQEPLKQESTAAGLLRRFSNERRKVGVLAFPEIPGTAGPSESQEAQLGGPASVSSALPDIPPLSFDQSRRSGAIVPQDNLTDRRSSYGDDSRNDVALMNPFPRLLTPQASVSVDQRSNIANTSTPNSSMTLPTRPSLKESVAATKSYPPMSASSETSTAVLLASSSQQGSPGPFLSGGNIPGFYSQERTGDTHSRPAARFEVLPPSPPNNSSTRADEGRMSNASQTTEVRKNSTEPELRVRTNAAARQLALQNSDARIHNDGEPTSTEIYSSQPIVHKQHHDDALHASAVAMAKQMYRVQQQQQQQRRPSSSARHRRQSFSSTSSDEAAPTHRRRSSPSTSGDEALPMQFDNLQESVQKAQGRVAKFYGRKPPTTKNSMATDPDLINEASPGMKLTKEYDEDPPRKRNLSKPSVHVNRAFPTPNQPLNLRNTTTPNDPLSMNAMTQESPGSENPDTGKASPSLLNEWEARAHAMTRTKSDTGIDNYGQIHLGRGKSIDPPGPSKLDIAAATPRKPVPYYSQQQGGYTTPPRVQPRLRSRPTTPTLVADVQTKRTIRRSDSLSSIGSSVAESIQAGLRTRETEKAAPSLLKEWESKAYATAQARSDTRIENHGKVHIGGGKFIDPSDKNNLHLVARKNVKGVLDGIDKTIAQHHAAEKAESARKLAEKERERDGKALKSKKQGLASWWSGFKSKP